MNERLLQEWVNDMLLIEQTLDTNSILSALEKLGYDNIKKISSRRFAVLIDGPTKARSEALGKIENELKSHGAVWDKQPSSVSSMGMVKLGNTSILVKPASRQGGQSAGLGNESILVDAVNNHIHEFGPVDVEFLGPGAGSFLVKGVTAAEGAGSDTKGRKKSDVNLVAASGKIPISVKKDNAVYWESADTFYGPRAATKIDELLESGEIEIIDKGGYYNISPNIAIAATPQETKDVVFGNDILGNGAVIKKTFTSGAFSYDQAKNTLVVQSTYVITDISHVTGDYSVWFFIRNDKTRKSVPGYPGIRVLAAYEKRINSNVKRFDEGYNLLRHIIREAFLHEELTKSDKKEIEKIAKKHAKAHFDKEIDKAVGTSFFGNKGKVNKFVDDEIDKRFKSGDKDKDFSDAVEKIAKRVIQALYTMHYKRNNLIKGMPVPKS